MWTAECEWLLSVVETKLILKSSALILFRFVHPVSCTVLPTSLLFRLREQLRSIVMSVSVSVCPRKYLRNHMCDLHQIFNAYCLWLWLGPPPALVGFLHVRLILWMTSCFFL